MKNLVPVIIKEIEKSFFVSDRVIVEKVISFIMSHKPQHQNVDIR